MWYDLLMAITEGQLRWVQINGAKKFADVHPPQRIGQLIGLTMADIQRDLTNALLARLLRPEDLPATPGKDLTSTL